MKFSHWALTDGGHPTQGLNHHPARAAQRPALLGASGPTGVLWGAWAEAPEAGHRTSIRVGSPDGNGWVAKDGGGPVGVSTNELASMLSPVLVERSGQVQLGLLECAGASGGLARVLAEQGGGVWGEIDQGGLNRDPDQPARHLAIIAEGAELYAAWSERSPLGWRLRCARQDAQGNWSFLDGGGPEGLNATEDHAQSPTLAWYGGKLHLAWLERRGTWGLRSAAWDAQTGWTRTDGGGPWGWQVPDDLTEAQSPRLVASASGLLLTWGRRWGRAVNWHGRFFDGSSWAMVGPPLGWVQPAGFAPSVCPWGEGFALLRASPGLRLAESPDGLNWSEPQGQPEGGFTVHPEVAAQAPALAYWWGALYALWCEAPAAAGQNSAAQIRAARFVPA